MLYYMPDHETYEEHIMNAAIEKIADNLENYESEVIDYLDFEERKTFTEWAQDCLEDNRPYVETDDEDEAQIAVIRSLDFDDCIEKLPKEDFWRYVKKERWTIACWIYDRYH